MEGEEIQAQEGQQVQQVQPEEEGQEVQEAEQAEQEEVGQQRIEVHLRHAHVRRLLLVHEEGQRDPVQPREVPRIGRPRPFLHRARVFIKQD